MKNLGEKWDIPLIVIGQQQRCGGTLLNRLFDAHPSLFVYPFENFSGRPNKYHFPCFSINTPLSEIWENIKEGHFIKWGLEKKIPKLYYNTYDFIYDSNKHKERFLNFAKKADDTRSMLQIYFYSFFLSIENLYKIDVPKFYLYFTPRQCLYAEEFFDAFPDGHMIQIIRNPIAFYNSGQSHDKKEYSLERSKFLWELFVLRAIDAIYVKHWKNYHVIFFEDLVTSPSQVMQQLLRAISVPYNDTVLIPTLNGESWGGDSHFQEINHITPSVIDQYNNILTQDEISNFDDDIKILEILKTSLLNHELIFKKHERSIELFHLFLSVYKKEKPLNITMFDLEILK
jgi:hypothetical protein